MTRFFRVDRPAVVAKVTEWAQTFAADANVVSVVLFGSFARGDSTAASDVDVLVVLRQSAEPFGERMLRYGPAEHLGVTVEVFPYTLDELRQGYADGWGMARPALAEGKTLYGADLADLLGVA